MIALGIDVSTKKLAAAGMRDGGRIAFHALELPAVKGARRLAAARATASAVLAPYRGEAPIILVEIPRGPRSRGSGFALLAVAGVVMEAAQTAVPDAVVMEVTTATWKLESVGRGNASKEACLEHARALGYPGADQDIADALCMAHAARRRWERHEKELAC